MDIDDFGTQASKALAGDDTRQRPKRKFEELSREDNNVIGECSLIQLEEDMGNIDKIHQTLEKLRKCTSMDEVQEMIREPQVTSSEIGELALHQQKKQIKDSSSNLEWTKQAHSLKARLDSLTGGVRELIQQGSFPEGIMLEVPMKGIILPTKNLVGETTARRIMEEIWCHLMDEDVTKLGVYGMGGIGKTTVIKHIHNRLLDEGKNKFDKVIWVTVSSEPNIKMLQDKIKIGLDSGRDLFDSNDIVTRAGVLFEALKAIGRYVVILDDMWEDVSLNEIGIPEPTPGNGCKLVLTTRLLEVCTRMDFKPIEMVCLYEKEALDLFLDHVGPNVVRVEKLRKTVEDVVKECDGLPLAIVNVAEGMRGELKEYAWNTALKKLKEHSREPNDKAHKVIRQLRFSYDRLKNENERLQHCLLYCALYPEDYEIDREDLIQQFMFEGIIEEMEFDEGNVLLDTLINSCLLEAAKPYGEDSATCVRMHDLIRDMSLQITSVSPRFMVKAGLRLKELPGKWPQDVEKVSLMQNKILEIPSGTSPQCPNLSTLFLNGNPFEGVPDSFFAHMHGLKVLNLSRTSIEFLPHSMSHLVNLVALSLSGCSRLNRVQVLEKLTCLNSLDVSYTAVEVLPKGLEKLTNLRYLNLAGIKKIPDGILSNLSHLQHLIITRAFVKAHELMKLKRLEIFVGLLEMEDFIAYVEHMNLKGRPSRYNFQVRSKNCDLEKDVFDTDYKNSGSRNLQRKSVCIKDCEISESGRQKGSMMMLPRDVRHLMIEGCSDVTSLCDLGSFEELTDLRVCELESCKGMTHFLSITSSTLVFQSLETLNLWNLTNLKIFLGRESIASSVFPPASFSQLKEFCIHTCPKIKELFTPEVLSNFQNLEVIKVIWCGNLRKIVSESSTYIEKETIKRTLRLTLPKLRELYLLALIELMSICPTSSVLVCESLKHLTVDACAKLKRIPLHLPLDVEGQPSHPSSLQSISIEAKDVLEGTIPFFSNDELESQVIDGESSIPAAFPKQKKLFLLKELTLTWLSKKALFTPEVLSNFQNLEFIDVSWSHKLMKIVTESSNYSEENEKKQKKKKEKETIKKSTLYLTLPKLTVLNLSFLPELMSICPTSSVLVCESLEYLTVCDCPKLKRMPLHLPLDDEGQPSHPPSLRHIKVQEEQWHSLKLDQPKAKDVLERFLLPNYDM